MGRATQVQQIYQQLERAGQPPRRQDRGSSRTLGFRAYEPAGMTKMTYPNCGLPVGGGYYSIESLLVLPCDSDSFHIGSGYVLERGRGTVIERTQEKRRLSVIPSSMLSTQGRRAGSRACHVGARFAGFLQRQHTVVT
jgi:hypothetical protein